LTSSSLNSLSEADKDELEIHTEESEIIDEEQTFLDLVEDYSRVNSYGANILLKMSRSVRAMSSSSANS
jgi:hypothetical protein